MLDPRKKKWSVAFLLVLLLFVQVGSFFPRRVFAQLSVAENSSVPHDTDTVLEQILSAITGALLTAALNGVTYFVRKIAYDAATYIASGGKGQGALVYEQGFDKYITGTLLDTAGEAIGQLGEPFGLNLCQFPDLDFQVFLQIGLRNLYGAGPPQPNCTWQQLRDGWSPERFTAKYGGNFGRYIGEKFSSSLSVQNSDFGIALGAIARIDALQITAKDGKTAERLEGQGVKPLTDLVSGNIKTPAELIRQDLDHLSATEQANVTAGQYWDLVVNTDNLIQLAGVAAGTFLNTLTSQLLQKFLTKGFLPEGGQYDPSFFGAVTDNRRAAEQAFSSLLTPTIPESGTYDIASEFAACPEKPGLNNCVVDSKLQAAIDRARTQTPLTIREAMQEGLLHGDWRVISPRNEVENTNKNCFRNTYCYSNIQKLRKARIMPLGFEIAALKADPANPPTLQEIVDGFERCAVDGSVSPQFPWCHLVNPNWVIKAPEILSAKLIGPELVDSGLPQRREEYMDFSTCVLEDANGECLGNYGYCTQEKNIWRLGGDACEPQYNTCKAYASSAGQRFSYLSRTLDFGECTADDVGCRLYSTVPLASGGWQSSASADTSRNVKQFGRNEIIYLNGIASGKTCAADANGCMALSPAIQNPDGTYAKDRANLFYAKKAPIALGCYDANPGTDAIDLPQSVAEIENNIPANPACDAFASVCVEAEVGCEAYTPTRVAGARSIPGIIGGNACDARCVGYDTFRQEATNFEPSRFPEYFIPAAGRSCDAVYAGCDEFTNLDEVARGGEGLEYYTAIKYCEKPDGVNERVFYSWEGSAVDGFVLRVHRLLQTDQGDADYLAAIEAGGGSLDFQGQTSAEVYPLGSPAADDWSRAALLANYAVCNDLAYQLAITDPTDPNRADPDCRALYDDAGTIYYRLLSHTVTVSEDCHPLRKTASELYTDTEIQTQAICETNAGGVWGNNICQRCYQGGRYVNGSCVYQTISRVGEGSSCPASANGCRAYVGNTGNNRQTVFDHTFEPVSNDPQALLDARADWDSSPTPGSPEVRVASEALQLSGHSLFMNVPTVRRAIPANMLRAGSFYELSFWARSVATQNLAIAFVQDADGNGIFTDQAGAFTFNVATNRNAPETIGASWQEYSLGPVAFTGDPSLPTQIFFIRQPIQGRQPSEYFLDYVRLTALEDLSFIVKDSWKTVEGYDVPLVCDATPNDVFPGAALGCTEYKDSAGTLATAAGFESLCREKAVGCRPVYDTENTVVGDDAEELQIFNLWCDNRGAGGTVDVNGCFYSLVDDAGSPAGETPRCTVPVGGTGCYIPKFSYPYRFLSLSSTINSGAFRPSTIVIPADTPEATPLFLAVRNEFLCRERDKGCMKLGLEDGSAHIDTYLLNDPDTYADAGSRQGILCREEVLGCGEFSSGGSVSYFRDPAVTGAGTCSYRTDVDIGGVKYDGWFQDGGSAVPCYDTYLRRTESGLVYDIRSNSDPAYAGRAGQCPTEANTCTELVDPADTSTLYPNGQPYYVLLNDKITDKVSACGGQVSLTEGCVLVDQTENPNKLWSTTLSYARSEQAVPRFSLVSPRSAPQIANNDANLILKVDRDRACGEWLACRTAVRERDAAGNLRTLCTQYKACDATAPGQQCTHWVPEGSAPFAQLSEAAYLRRDTSWYGTEYSGYSLFNKYQITDLSYLNFDLGDYDAYLPEDITNTKYLARIFPSGQIECQPPGNNPTLNTNWQQCGPSLGGRCYGQQCLLPIAGRIPSDPDIASPVITPARTAEDEARIIQTILGYFTGGSCKVFPERTSPFPGRGAPNNVIARGNDTIQYLSPDFPAGSGGRQILGATQPVPAASLLRSEVLVKKQGFDNANVCQDGNCSCQYTKLVYKGGTADYWPGISLPDYAPDASGEGVCGSGAREGIPCREDIECGSGTTPGVCNFLQKKETHLGLSGFCLEYDVSRPTNGVANFSAGERQSYACLTWLPIQVSASNVDFFNTVAGAGYLPDRDAVEQGTSGNPLVRGEAYCSVATRVGGRVDGGSNNGLFSATTTDAQVATWDSQYFTASTPANARGYFLASTEAEAGSIEGMPRISSPGGIESQDCNQDNNYPYRDLACSGSIANAARYEPLQVWAWHMLGANSLVLRVERKRPDGFGVTNTAGANNTCGNSCSNALHLLPPPGWLPDGTRSFGTLVHPPRTWGDASQLPFGQTDLRYSKTPALGTNGGFVEARGLSSEPFAIQQAPGANAFNDARNYIIQSTAESTIRETDIQRMHFLPLAFPYDADGLNPNLLSPDIFIDFRALNSAPGRGWLRTTTDAFREDGGAVGSAEYYLPDRRDYQDTNAGSNEQRATAYVWSYKQEAGNMPYALPFSDYRQLNGSARVAYYTKPATALGQRNLIASRYVAVFVANFHERDGGATNANGDPGPFPAFIPTNFLDNLDAETSAPQSAANDPFLSNICDGNTSNWFAIGMDFNANGEFLGYISRWCYGYTDSSPGNDDNQHGIMLATVAALNDHCTEFARVYNGNSPTGVTNKAWTQRVWEQAMDESAPTAVPLLTLPHPFFGNTFRRDQAHQPFGSLALLGGDLRTTNGQALRNYSFSFDDVNVRRNPPLTSYADGVPYSCTETQWLGFRIVSAATLCGPNTPLAATMSNRTRANGYDGLHQLFARVFDVVGETNPVIPTHTLTTGLDRSRPGANQVGASLLPPQIYSLNPARCFTGAQDERCTAGEANNMTVNERNFTTTNYDGLPPAADEDLNQDGVVDPIIGIQQLDVIMQFFAFADDNRMPVRRMRIDWGEGLPVFEQYGFFRNRKPFCNDRNDNVATVGLCGASAATLTPLTCMENRDCPTGQSCFGAPGGATSPQYVFSRFGNAPRACSTDRFAYTYAYTCNQSDLPALRARAPAAVQRVRVFNDPTNQFYNRDAYQRLTGTYGLSDTSDVCVFRPRVQVQDNWEWCNGNTAAGYWGETLDCEARDVNAYTPYRGFVVVVPR